MELYNVLSTIFFSYNPLLINSMISSLRPNSKIDIFSIRSLWLKTNLVLNFFKSYLSFLFKDVSIKYVIWCLNLLCEDLSVK